jgi:drug/metabolite transporter, DME family
MIKGYAYIALAATLWGITGIFSRIAFSEGLSSFEVAFWRAALSSLFFAIKALLSKETKFEKVYKDDLPLLIGFGLFGISLFYITFQFSIKFNGVGVASLLLYTAPVWVIFTSKFIFNEKITLTKFLCLIVALIGVFLISLTSISSFFDPKVWMCSTFLGLISGFLYSLYYSIGKHYTMKYSSNTFFFIVLTIGAIGIFPFVNFVNKTGIAWIAIISVCFFSTFLPYLSYYKGLKYLEASKAAIVATIEPIVACIVGFMFLGEKFSLLGYFGASLVISSILLIILKK